MRSAVTEAERAHHPGVAVRSPALTDVFVEVGQRARRLGAYQQFGGADRAGAEEQTVTGKSLPGQNATRRIRRFDVDDVASITFATDREHLMSVTDGGSSGGFGGGNVVLCEVELRAVGVTHVAVTDSGRGSGSAVEF